jgi:HK97 family phage major capsid protein
VASGMTTNASELTREQVVATLIEPLMAESVVLRAGPRIFESQGGAPVRIPKITAYPIGTGTGASASYWHGENEQITEADPEFGEVTLLPSTLKSIKVLHRFSNELARHSVVNIANALRDAIVTRVRLALDRAFLIGEGTNNTVRGIVNQPGIQTRTYGTLEVDDLFDAVGDAMTANADPSCWIMHPAAVTELRKLRDGTGGGGAGTGNYLLTPDLSKEGGGLRLLGYPVFITTQMPSGTVLLIDMKQVAIGRDVDVSVKVLDQTFGDWDQLALRVVSRWNLALLNPEGIIRLTS